MSSQVEIANLAFSRLGAARITSFSDNTVGANLVNAIFDDVVDDVLVEGPWTCSIIRQALNQLAGVTPAYDYIYAYQLPVNPYCLKVLDVWEDKPGDTGYSIEGRMLLCNEPSISIRYISRVEDTDQFDPLLKRAIVSRLVAEMAYAITGDKTTVQSAWQKYELDVQKGLSIDTQQGAGDKITADTLLDVR